MSHASPMNRYARDFIIRTWLTACMVAGVVLMSVAPVTAQSAPAPLAGTAEPTPDQVKTLLQLLSDPQTLRKAWAEAVAARCRPQEGEGGAGKTARRAPTSSVA
jgi:hypothetical protein